MGKERPIHLPDSTRRRRCRRQRRASIDAVAERICQTAKNACTRNCREPFGWSSDPAGPSFRMQHGNRAHNLDLVAGEEPGPPPLESISGLPPIVLGLPPPPESPGYRMAPRGSGGHFGW